ncbi:hypothetical protein HMPREF1531_00401 [Propionibacterium sp. oral taxon 192 str. F0372]|uniref:TetR/AcrR family transcriptional regulator n=1 Tax=Propionibacterium sp. oral taxon 192 TaxID=671222 RepID=UPI000353F8E2|nr:TetR/AcrR family transcriptional regulator [Propionibacterium sp. oral taxon 192]EPH06799.1 hypothetical protein HMPREF1531_00401 [Propionibacterium sp. oral taxon 192 str. F0372]
MTQHHTPSSAIDSRKARTDALLARIVDEQLRNHGYAGVTIERVSDASGVAKTTIYRRWRSKTEMLFDLMIHRITQEDPLVPAENLKDDVLNLARRAVTLVASYPGRDILPGLLADAATDPDLAERIRTTWVTPAREVLKQIIGTTDLGIDFSELHATLLGVPYTRVHLLGETDLDVISHDLADHLLVLARSSEHSPHSSEK